MMFKCFGIYNRIQDATSSSEQEIYTTIVNYMTTNNINYEALINDYKSITYTENNICHYLDCILYLNYDRTNEFIDYIINEYFLKKLLLEQIKHHEIINDKINNMCGNKNKLTDEILLYLNNHVKITSLNTYDNSKITDESVKHLINLTILDASDNSKITDESVKYLTNLTSLDAYSNSKITDERVKYLINLTSLDASDNSKITDERVKYLINLTSLDASDNSYITDESVKHLTNLASLNANFNLKITDKSVKHLTNLTTLVASNNDKITDESVKHLTNLTELYVSFYDEDIILQSNDKLTVHYQ